MSNKITFAAGLSKSKKIYEFPVFYVLLPGAELYPIYCGALLAKYKMLKKSLVLYTRIIVLLFVLTKT
jgi:hypothetical protein